MNSNLLDDQETTNPKPNCTLIGKIPKRTFIAIIFVLVLLISLLCYFLFVHDSSESSESSMRYDFVVIGSGPAGSIVAARLAQKNFKVLLLEAGNTTQYELNGTLHVTATTNLTLFDIPMDWDVITLNASYSKYIYSPRGNNYFQLCF